jgi:hypothetical protein
MLTHPTLDQLNQLGLFGMAKAFGEAEISTEAAALTDPEWLALLLDREMTCRHDKKLAARLRYARLRQQALVEDVDYRAARGLDRPLDNSTVAKRTRDRILGHVTDVPGGYGRKGSINANQMAAISALEPEIVKQMREILMLAKDRAESAELIVLRPRSKKRAAAVSGSE